MTINISLPEGKSNLRPHITVLGVGGAGGNAVNNMINSNLEGVDFLIANTDAQALENSLCKNRIQLGLNSTKGLGAGMRPDIGKVAAEEAEKDIEAKLSGCNMAFIAAGMGGGTGTGAAPVIAKLAREHGILTVGVVTKPFHFEGIQRMKLADQGIEDLEQYVDTLLIIPNQNLFRIANEKTTFSNAFKMADDVLYAGVRGVTDLMVMPGLINLDFSDVKTVMSEMGKAMMGTGEAQGENRSVAAAEAAIANPLIDDVSLKGAKGLIINITGGKDLTLYEVDEAANRIREEVDVDANIIFGSTCDDRLEGIMRVSIVATGIEGNTHAQKIPITNQAFKIDNSVYKKPLSQPIPTISPNFLNEKKNHVVNENLIQEKLENNKFNGDMAQKHEENLIIDKENENIALEKVTNQESDNITKEDNTPLDDNKIYEETLESNHNDLNDVKSENTNESENTTVRRISLFDNIEGKENSSIDKNSEKKEPFLDHIIESDKHDNDHLEENHFEGFEQNTTDYENQLNQDDNINNEPADIINEDEDELLDIPTFLRRQAN